MVNQIIRTGDVVLHRPSNEKWVVAYVKGGYLSPCGWPCGEAKVIDCELIESCTDEEHLTLLQTLANMSEGDPRRAYAREELERRRRTDQPEETPQPQPLRERLEQIKESQQQHGKDGRFQDVWARNQAAALHIDWLIEAVETLAAAVEAREEIHSHMDGCKACQDGAVGCCAKYRGLVADAAKKHATAIHLLRGEMPDA